MGGGETEAGEVDIGDRPDEPRSRRGWTGFTDKTLWDWLQLLGIPLALAFIAFGLSLVETHRDHVREDARARRELARAIDAQREDALSAYLERMSDLLLHERLAAKQPTEARNVARALTLTVLRQLDGERKGLIARFLFEAGLLTPTLAYRSPLSNPVRLRGADLRGAILRGIRFDRGFAELGDADWRGADFSNTVWPVGVDFTRADLREANFTGAVLAQGGGTSSEPSPTPYARQAPFAGACLTGTQFARAGLAGISFAGAEGRGVDFRGANLAYADFRGAAFAAVRLENAHSDHARLPPRRRERMPTGRDSVCARVR